MKTTTTLLAFAAILAALPARAEDYPAALDLNLMSVVRMCLAAVPAMQAQRWGRVVAITSIAVRQPIPTLILSNTARAGATGFLKSLAREGDSAGRRTGGAGSRCATRCSIRRTWS